jgi:pantetheine-phosphate adenylyltransferase
VTARRAVTAVVPGSFDPVTCGHEDVIRRAAALFDHVVVGVLVNPAKTPLIDLPQRVSLITAVVADLPHVRVEVFEGLLVAFAARCGARVVVRGLRTGADFDYEWPMARMNSQLAPGLDTVYLAASAPWAHVSSSLVRDVHRMGGAVDAFVPAVVAAHLRGRDAAVRTPGT